jgi:hypothetical protein
MSAVHMLMGFDVTVAIKLRGDRPLVGLNVEITLTECSRKINIERVYVVLDSN